MSLYVIPMLMALRQLEAGQLPFLLDDRAAPGVALALAAIAGCNLLLAPAEHGVAVVFEGYARS